MNLNYIFMKSVAASIAHYLSNKLTYVFKKVFSRLIENSISNTSA